MKQPERLKGLTDFFNELLNYEQPRYTPETLKEDITGGGLTVLILTLEQLQIRLQYEKLFKDPAVTDRERPAPFITRSKLDERIRKGSIEDLKAIEKEVESHLKTLRDMRK